MFHNRKKGIPTIIPADPTGDEFTSINSHGEEDGNQGEACGMQSDIRPCARFRIYKIWRDTWRRRKGWRDGSDESRRGLHPIINIQSTLNSRQPARDVNCSVAEVQTLEGDRPRRRADPLVKSWFLCSFLLTPVLRRRGGTANKRHSVSSCPSFILHLKTG